MSIKLLFILFIIRITLPVESTMLKRGKQFVKRDVSILDTGNGVIGKFLSDSVKNLQPLRKQYYWRIHHYNLNLENVWQEVNILPRDITLCEGNVGKFCPRGSNALCSKNGAIRCLTSLWSTDLCENSINKHCANISVPCDIYIPECRVNNKEYFNIALGCISSVNIFANLVNNNETIIAKNLVKIYPPKFFCETILAMPAKLTKVEEIYFKTSNLFGRLAVKALGI